MAPEGKRGLLPLLHYIEKQRMKPETRRPKSERSPKAEIRIAPPTPKARFDSGANCRSSREKAQEAQKGGSWSISLRLLRFFAAILEFCNRLSGFGFRPSFGLRISGFGFRS